MRDGTGRWHREGEGREAEIVMKPKMLKAPFKIVVTRRRVLCCWSHKLLFSTYVRSMSNQIAGQDTGVKSEMIVGIFSLRKG